MFTPSTTSLIHAFKGTELVHDADYFVEICCQIAQHDSSQEARNLINRLVEMARDYSPRHHISC